MLLLLAAICFLIAKIFFPEFYSNTITLTLAGDVDSLSRYISSFGYGAFAVSLFLLILCNVFGIPTIPFLTINGVLFGLLPGIIISWIGEVIGIEISFHIGRIFFRDEARRIIEKKAYVKKSRQIQFGICHGCSPGNPLLAKHSLYRSGSPHKTHHKTASAGNTLRKNSFRSH